MTHYLLNDIAYPANNLWATAGGRPLVVIDPEDREQVERLIAAVRDASNAHPLGLTLNTDVFGAALRSLIAPPKPPEPTGLGAVVEDAEGVRWVLYTGPHSTAPWTDGSTSVEWEDVAAVKVLSEGVTA